MNKKLKRYLITAAVGLVIVVAVFIYEIQIFDIRKDTFTIISNSAFVAAVLMLIAGVMCFVSNGGGFDAFAYLSYRIRKQFKKKKEDPDGYFEFVMDRRDRDKIPLGNLFLIGGVLLVVAIVAAILA